MSAATAEELFTKNTSLRIGLITAVLGERGQILEAMKSSTSIEKGGRTYYQGKLHGIETVLVAAAATTAHLILDYDGDLIIFIGVAGAVDPSLNIGDIIVANALIQHDMDARPVDQDVMSFIPRPILNEFNITNPSVKTGKVKLREKLPVALYVEMEGASVAQVCYEYGTPSMIRTISDYANHINTQVDIKKFVHQASGYYSTAVIHNMYSLISSKINELK